MRRLALLAVICLLCVLPAESQSSGSEPSAACLTFTKVFEGSVPDYIYLSVTEAGEANFRGSTDATREPQRFQLAPEVVRELFRLAATLNYFRGIVLEAPEKVAYLGMKTFTYESGGEKSAVSFNYTENSTATQLQALFERIGRGRRHVEQLEFRLHFDRLGILEVLRQFERDFNEGVLLDVEQFAPILERVANDRSLARLAQVWAQDLLRRVRGAPPRLELEYVDKRSGWLYRLIVDQDGASSYEARRMGDAPNPEPKNLPRRAVVRLWELLELETYLREAKSQSAPGSASAVYRFTYEQGRERHQVAFATPPSAPLAEMVHIFQQLLQQEYFRGRLQTVRDTDSLMLQVVLQELEAAVRSDALLAPAEFLPELESIVHGESYDPVTRQQAERVVAVIRGAGPASP